MSRLFDSRRGRRAIAFAGAVMCLRSRRGQFDGIAFASCSHFGSRQFASGLRLRRTACDLLDRSRDAAEERTDIGKLDQRQQQSGNPKRMYMGEKREQPEDGDDLKLYFLRLVRHALRQRVQSKEQDAERHNAG